jgi:hypothetical protein
MPVERGAGPVVPHCRARISVRGGLSRCGTHSSPRRWTPGSRCGTCKSPGGCAPSPGSTGTRSRRTCSIILRLRTCAVRGWTTNHTPPAWIATRTTGDNGADYTLDVLIRQLALLAGRGSLLPPLSLSERAHDFVDLLDEATRASHERGNRLLVVIDGLDEYDPTAASLELAAWLPGARTLPEQAKLLVASRAGAGIDLPQGHPLAGNLQRVTASETATEIQGAARRELERALKATGGFRLPRASPTPMTRPTPFPPWPPRSPGPETCTALRVFWPLCSSCPHPGSSGWRRCRGSSRQQWETRGTCLPAYTRNRLDVQMRQAPSRRSPTRATSCSTPPLDR